MMTVASKTRSWQKRPVGDPAPPLGPPAAPSMFPIRDYLMERWGGQNLSVENMWHDRPIVGGTAPSSHRGAAFDWRYMAADGSVGPGPGRETLLREVIPFLINHSEELNIQQIHDYVGCTIWKAERATNEDGGWKTQPRGSQMGQPWAGWIHIEAGEWGWEDGRPVAVKLGLAPDEGGNGGPAAPVTDLSNGIWGLWPLSADKPELRLGALGDPVLYVQSVIFHCAGGAIARDGTFGTHTQRRVRDLQRVFRLNPDGAVGARTWPIVDGLAALKTPPPT
jgi:Putative peptidoglycan binding domain